MRSRRGRTQRQMHLPRWLTSSRTGFLPLAFGLGVLVGGHLLDEPPPPVFETPNGPRIQACFTPQHRCLPLLIAEIQKAQREILVQAYQLTSKLLSQALLEAHRRGVTVKILADKTQEATSHSTVLALHQNGIPVRIDYKPRIAHNKVILIDGKTLIGGSYNFSTGAEQANAENVFILKDHPIIEAYQKNWKQRAQVSRPLTSPSPQKNKKR